ncbi:MAG: hypothetical protein M3Q75_01360, partial [Gemmatimonadota bacterium]|nr:hypothetical protein [Gemmatimonadota bacterium]
LNRPWPTPDAGMVTGGRVLPDGTSATGQTPDGRKVQVGLTNAVRSWPTPRAINGEHPGMQHPSHLTGAAGADGNTLKLHGRWTLALMGFPPDWCDDLPPDPLSPT